MSLKWLNKLEKTLELKKKKTMLNMVLSLIHAELTLKPLTEKLTDLKLMLLKTKDF